MGQGMKYKMKRVGLIVIVLFGILVIYAINNNEQSVLKKAEVEGEVPNAMRPSIMLDGSLYYITGRKLDRKKIDLDSVSYVKSVISITKYPENDGEINFSVENAKYVRIGDEVAIEVDGAWVIFQKDGAIE